jgi:hypothetical protein
MNDLPIACSLDAGELSRRLEQIEALGRDSLAAADLAPGRARLRFAPGDGVRERVEALASAEAECCPFLELAVDATPDAVLLTIAAPPDAQPVLDELVSAFGSG